MRKRISKLIEAGLVLATTAAGAMLVVPAVAQTQTATHKKTSSTSKSASGSASHVAASKQGSGANTGRKSSTTKAASSKSGKSTGKKSTGRTRRVKGQAAPTPERINEIQEALAKRGMFTGEPTGKWDDSTVDAMRKFQTENHLNPTGKLDAPTLQKLGFGSETAGVAAPTPPPNSTANRLLSKNTSKDQEPSDEN
ncbi:MAG TPA: peptidoglycan-binding domain-containing protein [Candidatus Acidoferrum sp.]|nr:peptidoglycan-binding domain-containing protein [Candidatus Acidoferrum sp.]